jgi:hypothetical protein
MRNVEPGALARTGQVGDRKKWVYNSSCTNTVYSYTTPLKTRKPVLIRNSIHFNADPDLAIHFNAVRILLLIKVMRIYDHWPKTLQSSIFKPLRLNFETALRGSILRLESS